MQVVDCFFSPLISILLSENMFQRRVTEEAVWMVAKMCHEQATVLLLGGQFGQERESKRE